MLSDNIKTQILFKSYHYTNITQKIFTKGGKAQAEVAKLVDAPDSKSEIKRQKPPFYIHF